MSCNRPPAPGRLHDRRPRRPLPGHGADALVLASPIPGGRLRVRAFASERLGEVSQFDGAELRSAPTGYRRSSAASLGPDLP
jgi:hypothetical protein